MIIKRRINNKQKQYIKNDILSCNRIIETFEKDKRKVQAARKKYISEDNYKADIAYLDKEIQRYRKKRANLELKLKKYDN